MRAARAALLAALVVAVVSASAGAATDRTARPALAAAPFAAAWAEVPATPAARSARNIAVFGAPSEVAGFNTILSCCNQLWNGFAGANEALHGAFIQNERGDWIKDLVSTASANAMGVSYTIKPNADWYWGGKRIPVTYKDFVYTLRQIDSPRNDIASRIGYSNVDPTRFTHNGAKQVTFFWNSDNCSPAYPCGPYANWHSLFGQLFPSFALVGMDFNTIWTNCLCGSDGRPVSDGPFYVSNFTSGQGVTLKANPFWAGRKPGLAEVDFKFITDVNALEQAMAGGQIDATQPPLVPVFLPLKNAPGITFDEIPGYTFDHLEFREGNQKAGPGVTKGSSNVLLRAPWMRQVIMLSLDRQRIVDSAFGSLAGKAKPLDSAIFYSAQSAYRRDFARWNFDPVKALAILKQHCTAGSGPSAPSPANTKIWQCAGLPATFNWTWNVNFDYWRVTEQIAKASLKSIGVQINETPLPPTTIFDPNGIPSGAYDIVEFTWITSGDGGDWYDTYRCFGPSNFTGYCSHKVDALLKQAQGTLDPGKRASLYQRADAIMATQVPVAPLYARPVPLIHRSDLLGMVPNPTVAGPVWNIQDWHWKR